MAVAHRFPESCQLLMAFFPARDVDGQASYEINASRRTLSPRIAAFVEIDKVHPDRVGREKARTR